MTKFDNDTYFIKLLYEKSTNGHIILLTTE